MRSVGKGVEVDFLDLPVKSRNKATTLFMQIKTELQKNYSLKELGLKAGTWYDVGLEEFVGCPKGRYLRIMKDKPEKRVYRTRMIRELNELYSLFTMSGARDKRLRKRLRHR